MWIDNNYCLIWHYYVIIGQTLARGKRYKWKSPLVTPFFHFLLQWVTILHIIALHTRLYSLASIERILSFEVHRRLRSVHTSQKQWLTSSGKVLQELGKVYPVASSMYNLCYSKASNNGDQRYVLYNLMTCCYDCCNLCNVKNEGNFIDYSFSLSRTPTMKHFQ